MLRVRPLVHTADLPTAAGFLQSLGLTPARDTAPSGSSAVFDAGGGRVALRSCAPGSRAEGTTALRFDVADVREFARRTAEAGTAVELSGEGQGLEARVIAADGTSFAADAGPRETGAPASPLSVLALWYTADVDGAVRALGDIGARPRTSSEAGTRHDFRAKNGGLVAVHLHERAALGLAFEYDGDVRALVAGLSTGGSEPVVVDESHGRSLRVRAPWGTDVWINERRRDLDGCTGH